MPICSRCQRRVWFWATSVLGGPCANCRREQAAADHAAARQQEAARRLAFEQSGALRRAWLGARRGALLGAFGLAVIAASLLALTGGPGVRYPFPKLALVWGLVSFGAVGVATLVGLWFSSWLIGVACLLVVGAAGEAVVGAYQGVRGRRAVFGESSAAPERKASTGQAA